jgi:hypothetical protein
MIALALLAGCTRRGNVEQGGVYTIRSACPQVAIPAATGDITLFDPATSRDASAIDVEATITNVRAILTKPRKAGDPDAAIDPMADPAIRTAVANASFTHLVGFELTADQLRYNATR